MKDYPQLGLRIPVETKAKLHALSVVSARPQWRLLSDAIDCYLRARPEAEQRQIQQILRRSRRKPAPTARRRRAR